MNPSPAEIIEKYIAYRDKIAALTAEHEARIKPYADAMTLFEGLMAQHMQDHGLDSVKAEGVGTAFHKTSTRVRVADRGAFNEFVKSQDDGISYFTNAVSKEMILEYIKANETPPPGVDYTAVKEIQFRRA